MYEPPGPTYELSPRLVKPWFRKPYVVYDVIKRGEVWYDPTYGNGGGDYRKYAVRMTTFKTRGEAQALVRDLSNRN